MSDHLHRDVRSALRAALLTVVKATTSASDISATLVDAVTVRFSRVAGSWLDDNYAAGDYVTTAGWTATGLNGGWYVTKLTAGDLTAVLPKDAALRQSATEAAGSPVTLSAGTPPGQSDEGVGFNANPGETWWRESYKGGPELRRSLGPRAQVRLDFLYMLSVFYPAGMDMAGADGMVDAIRGVLYPGTILTYNSRAVTIVACSRQGVIQQPDWVSIPIAVRGFAYTITPS